MKNLVLFCILVVAGCSSPSADKGFVSDVFKTNGQYVAKMKRQCYDLCRDSLLMFDGLEIVDGMVGVESAHTVTCKCR